MKRKLLLSLTGLVVLLMIMEIGGRLMFFHFRSEKYSGVEYLVSGIRDVVANARISKKLDNARIAKDNRRGYGDLLYSKMGEEVLARFKVEYEDNYKNIVDECRKINSQLIVVYFRTSVGGSVACDDAARDFFISLAEKYGVKFIDMTSIFSAYPREDVFLLPENGHLSRLGCRLLAGRLNEEVIKVKDMRSSSEYDGKPVICGDLIPLSAEIWNMGPSMPYRVIVNKQGFRATQDVEIPKKKQRVLCVGDSYTFGPYLPNHDTYPALLNKINPEVEAINAGICGYTITDEVSLFLEKAKFVAPDVVILQVVENDIPGLFWFMKNEFDRKHLLHMPSALEKSFMDYVVESNKMKAVHN